MNILVINAGSSSLKYQLMNPDTGDVTAKGLCERIGLDGRLTHKVPASGKKVEKDIPMPTHKEAIEAVMAILVDPQDGVIKSVDEIDAVGHRGYYPPYFRPAPPPARPFPAGPRPVTPAPRPGVKPGGPGPGPHHVAAPNGRVITPRPSTPAQAPHPGGPIHAAPPRR